MSRQSVVVVDHYDSYTWNLVHLIASVAGDLPRVVEHDQPFEWGEATHVVLSPGPGHPAVERDFALGRSVFELGLPVLGVCLGMQALVTTHGGTVDRAVPGHGEIAVVRHAGSGLFAGVPDGFSAVRYHSLAAMSLPDDLELTASDDQSGLVMAVAHRSLPLVGVQFHPESVLSEHGAQIIANFLELS